MKRANIITLILIGFGLAVAFSCSQQIYINFLWWKIHNKNFLVRNTPFENKIAYSQILRIEPRNLEALLGRAENNLLMSDFKTALTDLDLLCQLRPTKKAYSLRGDGNAGLFRFDEAVADYTRTEEYEKRGDCYKAMHRYVEALKDYHSAVIESAKHSPTLDMKIAETYKLIGNHQKCIGYASSGIKRRDREPSLELAALYLWRGESYSAIQVSSPAAISDFSNCIEICTSLLDSVCDNEAPVEAFLLRGKAYKALGESNQATLNLDECMQRCTIEILADPYVVDHYAWRGDALKASGRLTEAQADYDLIEPEHWRIRLAEPNRMEFAVGRNVTAETIGQLDECVKQAPGNLDLLRRRAYAYFLEDQFDKAIEDITRVIQIYPSRFDYRFRGKLYTKLQEYDQAISDFSRAGDYQSSGDCYKEQKKYNEALADYYRAYGDHNEIIRKHQRFLKEGHPYYMRSVVWKAAEKIAPIYRELGDDRRNVELLTAAIDVAPQRDPDGRNVAGFGLQDLAAFYLWRGDSNRASGQLKNSVDDFESCIQISKTSFLGWPHDEELMLHAGDAFKALGDNRKAMVNYNEVIQRETSCIDLHGNSSSVFVDEDLLVEYHLRASAFKASGRTDEANADLDRASKFQKRSIQWMHAH